MFKKLLNFILFLLITIAITNYILIIYELSNFDRVLGVVSQTRVFDRNWTHDPHANSLAYYPLDFPLDYQGTLL